MSTVDLAAICFSGKQTRDFLQGMVTSDVSTLGSSRLLPTLFCQQQGKVFALGYLLERHGSVWFIAPQSHVVTVLKTLVPYCQLSRVQMQRVSVYCTAYHADDCSHTPLVICDHTQTDFSFFLGNRLKVSVSLQGADHTDSVEESTDWLVCLMQLGTPILTESLLNRFTPNQLSLVPSAWVSLKKGCYCGQEIIARTHHLGKVKKSLALLKSNQLTTQIDSGQTLQIDGYSSSFSVLMACHAGDDFFIQIVGPNLSRSDTHMVLLLPDGQRITALRCLPAMAK